MLKKPLHTTPFNFMLVEITDDCIQCGVCVDDCMSKVLNIVDGKLVYNKKEGDEPCLSCGHCYAVCPKGAIIFNGVTADKAPTVDGAFTKVVLKRRSVRSYKKEPLSNETI